MTLHDVQYFHRCWMERLDSIYGASTVNQVIGVVESHCLIRSSSPSETRNEVDKDDKKRFL